MQKTLDTEKLSQGDAWEWRLLSSNYERLLLAQAYRIVRNTQDAEEVVQTVLMRLWIRRQRMQLIDDIEHYLVTSVRNQARNVIRPSRSRPKRVHFDWVMDHEPCAPASADPSNSLQEQERLDTIEDVERMLTDVQRGVFSHLRHEPTLSSRNIAEKLGCSHKNVLGILGRIRRTLASRLSSK